MIESIPAKRTKSTFWLLAQSGDRQMRAGGPRSNLAPALLQPRSNADTAPRIQRIELREKPGKLRKSSRKSGDRRGSVRPRRGGLTLQVWRHRKNGSFRCVGARRRRSGTRRSPNISRARAQARSGPSMGCRPTRSISACRGGGIGEGEEEAAVGSRGRSSTSSERNTLVVVTQAGLPPSPSPFALRASADEAARGPARTPAVHIALALAPLVEGGGDPASAHAAHPSPPPEPPPPPGEGRESGSWGFEAPRRAGAFGGVGRSRSDACVQRLGAFRRSAAARAGAGGKKLGPLLWSDGK